MFDNVFRLIRTHPDDAVKLETRESYQKLFTQLSDAWPSRRSDCIGLQLEVAYHLLQLPFLNPRITGILVMSWTIETLEKEPDLLHRVALWLDEKQLISLLFGSDAHVELISRSEKLFQLLAQEGVLKEENVRFVWDAHVGKHESVVNAIFKSIQVLPQWTSSELTLSIYQMLKELPLSQYTLPIIHMIRAFAVHALVSAKKNMDSATQVWFGMDISWTVLKQSSLPTEILDAAKMILHDLLEWETCAPQQPIYLRKGTNSLAKNKRLPQLFTVLRGILIGMKRECGEDMRSRVREVKLFEAFLAGFDGKSEETGYVDERLEFMGMLLSNNLLVVSPKEAEELWHRFSLEPSSRGWDFLRKHSRYLSLELRHFNGTPLDTLPMAGFNCLDHIFSVQHPSPQNEYKAATLPLEIPWQVLFAATNKEVGEAANALLLRLYESFLSVDLDGSCKDLVRRCMQPFADHSSPLALSRSVELLRKYVQRFSEPSREQGRPITVKIVRVQARGTKEPIPLVINTGWTVADLKRAVAAKFGDTTPDVLRLITGGRLVGNDYDTVGQCKLVENSLIHCTSSGKPLPDVPRPMRPRPLDVLVEYYELLYEGLNDLEAAPHCWGVLALLPQQGQLENQADWTSYLSKLTAWKLHYLLKTILQQREPAWIDQFVHSGGIAAVLSILTPERSAEVQGPECIWRGNCHHN